MNITITFSDAGDASFPEGTSVVFENIDHYELSMPRDVELLGCAEAGCEGCTAVHRRLTGTSHLRLEAAGDIKGGPLWKIPEAVT